MQRAHRGDQADRAAPRDGRARAPPADRPRCAASSWADRMVGSMRSSGSVQFPWDTGRDSLKHTVRGGRRVCAQSHMNGRDHLPPERVRSERDRRGQRSAGLRAARGAQGGLRADAAVRALLRARSDAQNGRVRRRQRGRRADVRGGGARRQRGRAGPAVRRSGRQAAGEAARGDRDGAQGGVYLRTS